MEKNHYDFMENGEVPPVPKEFFDQAKALDVEEIVIQFYGGSDEGHIDLSLEPSGWKAGVGLPPERRELVRLMNDWAFEKMSFSGAGPPDHGGSITYSLKTNKVSVDRWVMVEQTEDSRDDLTLEVGE
jgi:hypothetical protein